MLACPSCGDGLVFDPKTQKLLCLSCRNKYEPEEIEKMRLEQAKEVDNTFDIEKESNIPITPILYLAINIIFISK